MKKLEGKIAVITGGNSGMGLASAKVLKDEGASVVIVGRNQGTLNSALAELGAETLGILADVSKMEDLDRVFGEVRNKFGRIDILFANAGVANFIPVQDVTENFFDEIMGTNVKGLFFTVQKALPLLSKGASIILNSSSLQQRAIPGGSVYAASKAAVRSLGRGLAADLSGQNIRVNVISPGPIETPIFERAGLSEQALQAMMDTMRGRVPLKRLGKSEEIAKVVLFLASEDSSFIYGAEIAVDGGVGQL
jgi:NAD(P)-dependent dehydrogenase (short-subunit alcohol dehydrogenase family)